MIFLRKICHHPCIPGSCQAGKVRWCRSSHGTQFRFRNRKSSSRTSRSILLKKLVQTLQKIKSFLRHAFSGLQRAVCKNPMLSPVVSAFPQLFDLSIHMSEKTESEESKETPHGQASLPISSPLHPRVRTRVPTSSAAPQDFEQHDHSDQVVQPATAKIVTQ
jgi:hypothetical protein